MNWKRVGKVLLFVGIGIFVFNQIEAVVFARYYGVWTTPETWETIGYKIFDWFHSFAFAINNQVLGWPGLMIVGAALWIGGHKTGTG